MKRLLILSAVMIVAVLAVAVGTIVNPPEADGLTADALVVHAGGRGERLRAGLALVHNGAAPTLVVMNGTAEEWPEANALCGQLEPFMVLCPDADIENTVGEARELGELVAANGWKSVLVVTSDYHLRRASILDRRCAGEAVVRPVAAVADISTFRRMLLIMREVLALPQAYTTGCG